MNGIIPKGSWIHDEEHYLRVLESDWYKLLFKLQNNINNATMQMYQEMGISSGFFPITTGSISSPMGLGSDSIPVKVNLCGCETYLSDSMQFMLEYACRISEKGCYYIMPSFRGEEADARHLCQFFHSEVEIPGGLDDIIALANKYVKHITKSLLDNFTNDISTYTGNVKHMEALLSKNEIPMIDYKEAINILKAYDGCLRCDENGLLYITPKGEAKLIQMHGGFVWLCHMDGRIVPFYQAIDVDGKYAKCADLLFGIGEVLGSGERCVSGNEVRNALRLHEVDEWAYQWYITMKDKYPIRTSGFGMGIERFLLWVLRHNDIRDCQILPRFNGKKIYV